MNNGGIHDNVPDYVYNSESDSGADPGWTVGGAA